MVLKTSPQRRQKVEVDYSIKFATFSFEYSWYGFKADLKGFLIKISAKVYFYIYSSSTKSTEIEFYETP